MKQTAGDRGSYDKPSALASLKRTVSTGSGMTLEDLVGGVASAGWVRHSARKGMTRGIEEGIGVVVEEEEWEK